MQTDGKIVTVGFSDYGFDNTFSLARFNSDCSLDTTFAGTGKVFAAPVDDGDEHSDLAVFRNGIWFIKQSTNNQPR